jgi:5-methylcytosine-specific restriction endonuclease McrA
VARKEFPRKVKAAIIKRAAGRCEACKAVLKPGEGDVDHILPDALGGKPDAANGRLICKVCHAAKTAIDVGRIRKADRQRDKGTGAIRAKGRIPSPPKAERTGKAPLPPRLLFWPITGHSESGD